MKFLSVCECCVVINILIQPMQTAPCADNMWNKNQIMYFYHVQPSQLPLSCAMANEFESKNRVSQFTDHNNNS